ncbi:hypothetical protein [Microvirga brassicacearum]|uniref:Uncharacterized protein n=1 Tax=Microvirga brassicacearum TaxID=2580413 RepID=A0A5N3P3P4_9HYPH|nr:hypothetical protein [Microvirga brassicacearum]KAB0264358.1 hypothetical protein FEZ63_23980 [Microvirga brassicacearum]
MSVEVGLFPWSDESLIEQEADTLVNGDEELVEQMKVIVSGLGFLQTLLHRQPYGAPDELIALRLTVRLLNSASAALKLVRAGYYQPAFTMVRDVMEVEFLIDLFSRDRAQLIQWMTLSPKERENQFKPVEVRKKLDKRDGWTEQKRARAYKMLSNYAAHVTPEGFNVISPDNMTIIGPHPSPKGVKAVLGELVRWLPSACIHVGVMFHPVERDLQIMQAHNNFTQVLSVWLARVFPVEGGAQGDQTAT